MEYGSAKTYFVNNLRTAKYFLKYAGLPKRVWQGHNTSVGREDLLVYLIDRTLKAGKYDLLLNNAFLSAPTRYHDNKKWTSNFGCIFL